MAERQRQTWLAIHDAAAEETLEHGPDHVTVARIAERAGISPRTFFNYFTSKEDAIVGIGSPHLTDEVLTEFRAEGEMTPLSRVTMLAVSVASQMLGPSEKHHRRIELIRRHPDLRARLTLATVRSREFLIQELITEPEVIWDGIGGLPQDAEEATALIMVASGVVSLSWQRNRELMITDTEALIAESIAIIARALKGSL